MSLFLTRRGARLATVVAGVLCVMGLMQNATPVFAGYCCIPGNEFAGDSCYEVDDEETCRGFGLEQFGQGDVIYDDESYLRCNRACGQNTNFFRCQNRDEVMRGVSAPVCLQAQADGFEEGYVYKDTCEAACQWNTCDTCEFCNYANGYGEPCTKLGCEVNPTCVATRLPGIGEEAMVQDEEGNFRTVLNQYSCAPKADSMCVGSSSSASSYAPQYQLEACCIKGTIKSSPFNRVYVGATDNDTESLQAVYGDPENVQVLNYSQLQQQCAGVYEPYKRVWADVMPLPATFDQQFVSLCKSDSYPSSASSSSYSRPPYNPDDVNILACCHPQAKQVLIGQSGGGVCTPCTDGSCANICYEQGSQGSYCGLGEDEKECFADSQCQSNRCNGTMCESCETDDDCAWGLCNDYGECVALEDGEECTWDDACWSHSCIKEFPDDETGICGRLEDGEECAFNDQCQSRHCELDDPEMLTGAYEGKDVIVEDYGVVQTCSIMPGAAVGSWDNAMPTLRYLDQLIEECANTSNNYSGYPFTKSPPPDYNSEYPFTIDEPTYQAYNASSLPTGDIVYCDRRVGPIGHAVNILQSVTGDMCQPYDSETQWKDLDYYTLFIDDASVFCSEACPAVRRLSLCVSEAECTVMDTELCAQRGDYALGFPAKMAAGFDELTPDAGGNTGLDKYAYALCYQARYDIFGLGCDIIDNYTIDGQPIVPAGC